MREINIQAFETPAEADIVDKLRNANIPLLSLVAEDDKKIVGHILFSQAVIKNDKNNIVGMGLAPMAVIADRQKQGIGSLLVNEGIKNINYQKIPFVIVLGHPEYYPKFGFEPASKYNIKCQWDGVPDEAFMIMILDDQAMNNISGTAFYRNEFNEAI